MDNYDLALRQAMQEKQSQIQDFTLEKSKKQSIDDATSIFDIPAAEKLIEEGVKSSHSRAVLKRVFSKFMDEDKAEELISNVQQDGLSGLLNTDLQSTVKERTSNLIEGDGEASPIQRLVNVFKSGRDNMVDMLRNKPAQTLKDLKQKLYDEGNTRFNELKGMQKQKVKELRDKFNEVKERHDSLEEGDEKDALKQQLDDINDEALKTKADFDNQIADLKSSTKTAIKDIQEKINSSADDLGDSMAEIAPDNIGDAIPASIREGITTFKPSILTREEGNQGFIGRIKNMFSDAKPAITEGDIELQSMAAEAEPVGAFMSRTMSYLAKPGITGSDSTVARALGNSPKLHTATETPEAKPSNDLTPSTTATEDTTPADEGAGITEEAAGKIATKEAGEELGEEVGEGLAEAGAEAGAAAAGSSFLGPLALIVGLGTLIGQTIHNVHEAKEEANIKTINPSANFGV